MSARVLTRAQLTELAALETTPGPWRVSCGTDVTIDGGGLMSDMMAGAAIGASVAVALVGFGSGPLASVLGAAASVWLGERAGEWARAGEA